MLSIVTGLFTNRVPASNCSNRQRRKDARPQESKRDQCMRDGVQQISRAPHILLYSHDTFGLGHLRRSRAIAEALVSAIPGSSALILTGSPVAGRFTFAAGVDHIRMPGVVKTREGEYVAEIPQPGHRADDRAARQRHPGSSRHLQSRPDHRRQGAGRVPRRTHHHAGIDEGGGPGQGRARPARHPRLAGSAGHGMASQERARRSPRSTTTRSGSMATRASTIPCRASISPSAFRSGSIIRAICAATCRTTFRRRCRKGRMCW